MEDANHNRRSHTLLQAIFGLDENETGWEAKDNSVQDTTPLMIRFKKRSALINRHSGSRKHLSGLWGYGLANA